MSQPIQSPLDARSRPSMLNIEEWNHTPINNEKVLDVEWTDPATKQKKLVKLPYWVKFAIDVQYVFSGYALQDYLWYAINPPAMGDMKRAGFNLVAVANEMGLGKSSLSLQFEGQVYGGCRLGCKGTCPHLKADLLNWEPDWDNVLKYKILSREEIIPMWKEAKEMGRIKCLLLDDIDSIFSKELWFEDRPLYIKLRKALNLIRPRVANFIVTAPSLNDIISILNTKITFEVMPFPNQTYMVERYCRFVDQFSSTTNFFRKIETEYSKFRLGDLPSDVYHQYDQSRASKEEEEMDGLEKAMEESYQKAKDEEAGNAEKMPKRLKYKCLTEGCGRIVSSSHESGPSICPACRKHKFVQYTP